MMHFLVYGQTGEILRAGTCQDGAFSLQAREGEFVIEGDGDQSYDTHYVIDGVVLPYSEAEQTARSKIPRGFIWKMPDRIVIDGRTLSPAQATQLAMINAQCAATLSQITAGYPADEMQSWSKQEAEARAGGGPLIEALATARGMALPELIEKILAKADLFAAASGQIIGTRQRYEDQIKAATMLTEVDAIQWVFPPSN